MTEGKKGGRPRHNDEAKTAPINLRITPSLRAQIENAAWAARRSLSREVEIRLLASFGQEAPPSDADYLRQIIREEICRAMLSARSRS